MDRQSPDEKNDLETAKLKLEIAHLQSRWSQPVFAQIMVAIIAALIGGVLAISGAYFASKFQMSAQLSLQLAQEQRSVIARLMGKKFTTTQLYVSRYEALIFSDYHEERWKLAGSPSTSLDLQEDQRWMHRSEDLVSEITKNNQTLFEDIGIARAVFPDTPTLRRLTDRIYNFKSLWTAKPPHDLQALDSWKNEAERQLQAKADAEYAKPISELVEYLSQQLRSN